MAKKRIAAIIGQSNEQGAGVNSDRTSCFGYPLMDPVAPNGTAKRSMWPFLSELLGKQNRILSVYNSAVGSTSIVDSWVGGCRAWTTGMKLVRGSYCINGGNLYKADICIGFALTSTIAPTGTADLVTNEGALAGTWTGTSGTNTLTYSTTIPAALSGSGITGNASIPAGARISNVSANTCQLFTSAGVAVNLTGNVSAAVLTVGTPWSYVSAVQNGDTDGAVYTDGNTRFDPNGYMAAAYAGLSGSTGFDEKWAFISIGQGDRSISTVRARYALGLQVATNYMLSRNVKVAIGFTCYAATAGADAWYQSDLLSGYSDTLAVYATNSNVIAGANLRTALGVLSVTPANGPGLQSDNLHMNDEALSDASRAWASALLTGGW
jgi:hypothetical protein